MLEEDAWMNLERDAVFSWGARLVVVMTGGLGGGREAARWLEMNRWIGMISSRAVMEAKEAGRSFATS